MRIIVLVPAKPELAAAAVQLSAIDGGERYLADALVAPATDPYTFVFLDCPPAFGALTVNALAAADRVIVPVPEVNLCLLTPLGPLIRVTVWVSKFALFQIHLTCWPFLIVTFVGE